MSGNIMSSNKLAGLQIKFAAINVSTIGDNTIVAAVTNKKIIVLNYVIVLSAATTVRFEDGAGGTALTGQMEIEAKSGLAPGFMEDGHFKTSTGTLLNLELSAGNNADGYIVYVLE